MTERKDSSNGCEYAKQRRTDIRGRRAGDNRMLDNDLMSTPLEAAIGIPRDWALRVIGVLIIVLLTLGGWIFNDTLLGVKTSISNNEGILRRVEHTQAAVIERIKKIEGDIDDHKNQADSQALIRSQYHHTEIRSCLQCKTRDVAHSPHTSILPKKEDWPGNR